MVKLSLVTSRDVKLGLSCQDQTVPLSLKVGVVMGGGDVPPEYTGSYEATPTAYEQSLPTSGKSMTMDVTIHKVPYQEATNESGGYTVSILS